MGAKKKRDKSREPMAVQIYLRDYQKSQPSFLVKTFKEMYPRAVYTKDEWDAALKAFLTKKVVR